MRSSHSPHHRGLGRWPGGIGSSAGESRAVNTAYGFRTPAVFAPVADAYACGAQRAPSAASMAGRILSRCAAVIKRSRSVAHQVKLGKTKVAMPGVPGVT